MDKRKSNILIFPGYFLPHIGGLETHVDEFVKYLSKDENIQITIFAPNLPKTFEDERIHTKVEVIRYPAFELVSNFPVPKFWSIKFWKLFFSLYSKDVDIVMTRTRFFTNSTLGLIFAKFRLKTRKLIHVEHGSEYVKLSSKFKSFCAYCYDRTFGWAMFNMADKTVAISKAVHTFVTKEFIQKEKVPVIYRGVDFSIYDSTKKELDLENKFKNKTKCLFLGRLYKWKGVDQSIQAFKQLPKKVRDKTVFLIVGDGEDRSRLEELAGSELNKTIFFLGSVSFSKAITILKSCNVYVHSAFPGGGLSNSLLQAMYCELAIVASPHEGANEVINAQTGIVLKDNSVDELARGLIEILSSVKLQKKLGMNAKKLILTDFDWNNVVKKYKQIFDTI